MLLGEEPLTEGTLWKSSSLKIAYLSQDVNDLPLDRTPLEALQLEYIDDITKARTIFANMGMKEEKINQPIRTLSLGERMRVKLVGMLLGQYNVLILDEPTNHLDLPSREQLEKTLSEFPGTILVVSHDRYFLEKMCDHLLVFDNQTIRRVEMGEFEEKKNMVKSKISDEEMMLLETRITALLGEISLLTPEHPKYQPLDEELTTLMKEKREMMEQSK
jgi:macrolide transport system ATP-binding/permease protein